MLSANDETDRSPTAGDESRSKRSHPKGYRWLSVLLPQAAFNHLHIQARLSNMSFREYMERFCQEAFPYSDGACPEPQEPRHAS